ncbi:substrate-binding domain-containing protein [Luteolibacter ambystomatis]|uniref:Substrate-binding domain-containing protein n=1 Tax=Luteolibacter ambystomatis TaxID=2824561 RepID=A0A975J294_9BACT|nr:substrate-binding domain-containing protein [Luteolibacter ambystomatis]QUE52654.1 substrate-binding domain-containing protein [Luteolibacter ambystomatis]
MKRIQKIGLAGQTVEFLREQLRAGKWAGKLPGIQAMATQCGVSHDIMRAAVLRLEQEGWIVPGGDGKRREAVVKADPTQRRSLRVMTLLAMPMEDENNLLREAYLKMQALIETDGHTCRFALKTLRDLKLDPNRIKRYVSTQSADAWVVVGAPVDVLQWFADQTTPAIAFGGGSLHIRIAGTGSLLLEGLGPIYRRLIDLGHRRIVMIATDLIRHSTVIPLIREELAACGVPMSNYHVPEWDETPEGLQALLANAFHMTPPTALLVQNSNWLAGVISFLAASNLRVPQHISLVSLTNDPSVAWYQPRIGHLHRDHMEQAHHVSRWVNEVARGKNDRTFRPVKQTFIEADSVGSPPRK